MEPESGYSRYSVEVTNLLHRATQQEIHNLFTPKISGICSISYTPRSGKCTIELSSRANADAAVKVIGTIRELAFSPHGQSRTLKASLQAVNANLSYTQSEAPQRWRSIDESALDAAEQEAANDADLMALFDHLKHGGMKDSLREAVLQKRRDEGLVIKEIYLALGRRCELVFAGSRGQKDTTILRSEERVVEQHIAEFLTARRHAGGAPTPKTQPHRRPADLPLPPAVGDRPASRRRRRLLLTRAAAPCGGADVRQPSAAGAAHRNQRHAPPHLAQRARD